MEQFNPETERVIDVRVPYEEMRDLLRDLVEGGIDEKEAWKILSRVKMTQPVRSTKTKGGIPEDDREQWNKMLRAEGNFSDEEIERIVTGIDEKARERNITVTFDTSEPQDTPVSFEDKNDDE